MQFVRSNVSMFMITFNVLNSCGREMRNKSKKKKKIIEKRNSVGNSEILRRACLMDQSPRPKS